LQTGFGYESLRQYNCCRKNMNGNLAERLDQ